MEFFMKRKNNLYPAILPCLLNVASRKDMGTKKGLQLMHKFIRDCKIQYNKYYILKCDISKFFSSINHDILKEKILKRIKDKDAIKIVFDIIDSYSPIYCTYSFHLPYYGHARPTTRAGHELSSTFQNFYIILFY